MLSVCVCLFVCLCEVCEQDVMDVEKTYWALKGSGKFDLETFQQHISPPLPPEILPGMYVCHRVCVCMCV